MKPKKIYCPFKDPDRDTTCAEDCALYDYDYDGCSLRILANACAKLANLTTKEV